MDQGIQVKDKVLNYGTQLVSLSEDYFYNTSLQDAKNGVESGKYAAYVIIPAVFSERIWSVNIRPEKPVLEYALNPNLRQDFLPQVISDLKGLEMRLNADISYLYLYSIMDEFHSGQDSAATVMGNDKKDINNLDVLMSGDFMERIGIVELQPLDGSVQELSLNDELENISAAGDELEGRFEHSVGQTRQEIDRLFDSRDSVVWARDSFYTAVSGVKILEDRNGAPVFADGKNQLYAGIEEHGSALTEERNFIKDKLRWIMRRDPLGSEGSGEEAPNTWLAEIEMKHKSEKEAYNEALEAWRDSFDYSRLATPCNATASNATPCDATPSNATPCNATPSQIIPGGEDSGPLDNWLIDRDLAVVKVTAGGLYERIASDLEGLDLDEAQLDAVLRVIEGICMDEDILREQVATASNANPVMGSPDADAYIRGFFASMPFYRGDIQDVLDRVSQSISEFCQMVIGYIESRSEGLPEWFRNIFEASIEDKLDGQEQMLQDDITKELNRFTEAFDEYNREFKRYIPFQEEESRDKSLFKRILNENLADVEKKVMDKSRADEELIMKAEKSKETEVTALLENIDAAYESTSDKLKGSLDQVMDKKLETQEENRRLLNSFTKKLPYTRKKGGADTAAYEFLARPLETEERKLTGRSSPAGSEGFPININPVTGAISILVIVMGAGASALRYREGKRKAEQSI